MAASEKIYLKGIECQEFLDWIKTTPRKTKKFLTDGKCYSFYPKEAYEQDYYFKDFPESHMDTIIIYTARYTSLSKRLARSNNKMIAKKAAEQISNLHTTMIIIDQIFS